MLCGACGNCVYSLVCLSLFCVTEETERGLRVQFCAALPVPEGKSAQPPSQPTPSPLCVGPGRLPSHTGEYTAYAREAAKTFILGTHAHTYSSRMAGDPSDLDHLSPVGNMWASPWTTVLVELVRWWGDFPCGTKPVWPSAH